MCMCVCVRVYYVPFTSVAGGVTRIEGTVPNMIGGSVIYMLGGGVAKMPVVWATTALHVHILKRHV